jgi:NADH-quinone oxidoreductase subunit J
MLLNLKESAGADWVSRDKNLFISILTGVLAVGILYKLVDITFMAKLDSPAELPDTFGTVATVGEALFTDYVLPFEVASLLLLAAMIGAVVLAKPKLD